MVNDETFCAGFCMCCCCCVHFTKVSAPTSVSLLSLKQSLTSHSFVCMKDVHVDRRSRSSMFSGEASRFSSGLPLLSLSSCKQKRQKQKRLISAVSCLCVGCVRVHGLECAFLRACTYFQTLIAPLKKKRGKFAIYQQWKTSLSL